MDRRRRPVSRCVHSNFSATSGVDRLPKCTCGNCRRSRSAADRRITRETWQRFCRCFFPLWVGAVRFDGCSLRVSVELVRVIEPLVEPTTSWMMVLDVAPSHISENTRSKPPHWHLFLALCWRRTALCGQWLGISIRGHHFFSTWTPDCRRRTQKLGYRVRGSVCWATTQRSTEQAKTPNQEDLLFYFEPKPTAGRVNCLPPKGSAPSTKMRTISWEVSQKKRCAKNHRGLNHLIHVLARERERGDGQQQFRCSTRVARLQGS